MSQPSEKLKVEICLGTTCFILGSSELQDLESVLEPEIMAQIEIIGRTCLGLCRDRKFDGAPYVQIEDTIIEKATMARVIEAIKAKLQQKAAAKCQ